MNIPFMRNFGLFFLLVLLFVACRSNERDAGPVTLRARLAADPDRLNPMLATSGYANEVLKLTHFPLLEYHPYTLELQPVLAASLPRETAIDTGSLAGGTAYTYDIRPEATWDDGTPVTAADYIFTLKAAFNPLVKASAWRGYLSFIRDVIIDSANPRRFTVLTDQHYFLALPATGNFNLYPAHLYDPDSLLLDIPLSQLSDPASAEALAAEDPRLAEFAAQFTMDQRNRAPDMVRGAGPYQLAQWTTGQEIVLTRKPNWWGDPLAETNPILQARPDRIVFTILPDDQGALTLFRDGGLDIVGEVSPATYTGFVADTFDTTYETYLPVYMQYYYFALNNRSPLLAEKAVRRALAHCVDLEQGIATVLQGLGERVIGPFHPSKSYYHHGLTPYPYDPQQARSLLAGAGWQDTDGNGIVDKLVDGKRVDLSLEILLGPGSETGRNLALLLQDGARQAGIDIQLATLEFRSILQRMASRDYHLTPLRARQSPADDDPYQTWHSDSDRPDGSNRFSYRSAVADSLIMVIRMTREESTRQAAYRTLQEVFHEDVPVIFLYAPKAPVITRPEVYHMEPSPMRPGYYLPFLSKEP